MKLTEFLIMLTQKTISESDQCILLQQNAVSIGTYPLGEHSSHADLYRVDGIGRV
ncbi:MAG: hypothetical protein V4739_13040 [Pseudomonadota bacterium]